jgi:hypothetical protein
MAPVRTLKESLMGRWSLVLALAVVLGAACGGDEASGEGTQDIVTEIYEDQTIDAPVPDVPAAVDAGPDALLPDDVPTLEDVPSPDTGEVQSPSGFFSVGPIPASESEFAPFFSKHVDVFGLNVFATDGVPDQDLLHAAAVLAQYLDNDEDGVPDDLAILDALQSGWGGPASLVMFATESEIETSGIFETNLGETRALQDLYASETHPGGSSAAGFDATLEEVLHLVTQHGWAVAYPGDFGEEPGTSLGDAMDIARGGQFMSIPNPYPAAAWYHYNDWTCDYGCMATEYVYWALTSLLGAQDYPGRCADISVEWELCTAEQVLATDLAITALLVESGYALPTVLPDGSYDP